MQNAKLYSLAVLWPAWSRRLSGLAVVALGALLPPPTTAATTTVEAVQWPVWVERHGEQRPLAAGEIIENRDRLATGDGGRLLLRLADGSGVKLGENARLAVDGLGRRPGGVMTAALDVATGAFRFTTGLFQASLQHRAVNVRVATITAGVRGTDIWGKSDNKRDLICLLDGRITVAHPLAAEPQIMDQPLTFYVAAKGQAPGAVESIDRAQVAKWAAETEIQPGKGVGRVDGQWRVDLGSADSQSAALSLFDQVRAAGYPASVLPVRTASGYRYDVRVRGLASASEAHVVADRLKAALNLSEVSVGR